MKSALLIAILVISILPAIASTKTITVLGDKKVKTKWDGNMPKAMRDQGIETNVTGIFILDRIVVPTFGFDCSPKKKLFKVLVEDVTGKEAVLMVEDLAPEVKNSHWKGNSSPRAITPDKVPWLFTRGDTMSVFRFTVYLEGKAQPVVIYQPSVFRESSKVRLRSFAALMKSESDSALKD